MTATRFSRNKRHGREGGLATTTAMDQLGLMTNTTGQFDFTRPSFSTTPYITVRSRG